MLSQLSLIARNNIPTAILVLLTLALTTAFTIVCGGGGGSLGEGGDPLSIVGTEAFELELYSVDTYLAQDLPEELREDFTSMQEDFERFGIDFESVDQFVKVVLDCCSYRNVGAANGPRVYVFDGSLDLDAVRDKLEEEGFQSRMYGDYEAWEKQVLVEKFRGLDNFAAAFLTEEGYLVMGAVDGVREILHELDRAGENEEESTMERALSRVGDAWKESGRLDAQNNNNVNTHCAHDVTYRKNCAATAQYTTYSDTPLKTEVVALYGSAEDAQSESERLESNFERSDEYEPVDIEVVDLIVEGEFVDATIEHDNHLKRKWTRIY